MAGPARAFVDGRIHGRLKFRRAVGIGPAGCIVGMSPVVDDFSPNADSNSSCKGQKQSVSKGDVRINRPFSALFCQLVGIGFSRDFLMTAL